MSDRSQVVIQLFGVAGQEQEIADEFSGWGISWLDDVTPAGIVEGVEMTSYGQILGVLDEVGRWLEARGVSYWGCQDAFADVPEELRYFTPALGSLSMGGMGDATPGVPAAVLDAMVDALGPAPGLVRMEAFLWDLHKAAGRSHRLAIAVLIAGLQS